MRKALSALSLATVLSLAIALAACREEVPPENIAIPDLNVIAETPGDWTALSGMVGRTPAESGLFEESPIIVDLNARLGPAATAYREAMGDAGPLVQEGPVLVSISRSGRAYLVILPSDHAFEAGLKTGNGWRAFRTPGADVPRPASVQRLLAG